MVKASGSGLYVYAIVPTGDQVIFDVVGVDTNNDEVFTIPYHAVPASLLEDGAESSPQPLAAVVSASALPDYRGLTRPEAAAYLVAHQRVVETVMRGFPTLPVKFGTVLAGERQVTTLLAQGESLFNSALKKYGNRVQMEVIVLWNVEYVFQQIAIDETVQQAKLKLENCSPEEKLPNRIAIGKLVQTILNNRRAKLSAEILPVLQNIAKETMVNPLMDDSMVLNSALLLDEKGCKALDQTLEVLDASFEGRGYTGSASMVFRRVGPLPPYSFTTIDVQPLSVDAVGAARQLLGLEESPTLKEMQRAYHREVTKLHPDLHPELSGDDAGMTRISQAYRLLSDYAESRPAGMKAARCDLSREAISQAMLISIQRPDHLSQAV